MKKVIFCAVALFVGGMTYAQVTDADGNSSPTPNVIAPISGSAAGPMQDYPFRTAMKTKCVCVRPVLHNLFILFRMTVQQVLVRTKQMFFRREPYHRPVG